MFETCFITFTYTYYPYIGKWPFFKTTLLILNVMPKIGTYRSYIV